MTRVLALLLAALLLVACSVPAPDTEQAEPNELVIDVAGLIEHVSVVSPDQADRLWAGIQADPVVYFRLVNLKWAVAVCDAFADERSRMPAVSLHGDAHLEQYALNSSERGLDDFDDATIGPAVLDIVRFLGSVELAVRRLSWESERERLFDTFFDGYRRGLEDPSYMPPEPGIVGRIGAEHEVTQEEFLQWAESLMEPISPEVLGEIQKSMATLGAMYLSIRPELPPHYFDVKRAGGLRLGFGSAATPKVLFRLEGESPDPADDLIVEGKELSDVSSIGCITLPATGEVYRVISGNDRVGRLTHEIVAVAPRPDDTRLDLRDAWVRSWEPSFREIRVSDYQSADELAEVVHDAGAQLGAGTIPHERLSVNVQQALAQLKINDQLRPQIVGTAIELTDKLVAAWEIVRQQSLPSR